MARGGSKPGERRGGRKKGTPNKVKDNALVMLDAATREVRLLAAKNQLHKLGKDRLADLDGWAYDMAQRFAPTEDKSGSLYWNNEGDEIRFMRFLMFAARCAGLRAQYESPRYAAIALATQGQQTPEIYKRDPYKVMEEMVARFRAAAEIERAERAIDVTPEPAPEPAKPEPEEGVDGEMA